MHVVLSGYFGFHNTGDEAILLSMIKSLRKEDPDIRITVLSNDPIHTSETYEVEAADRWNLKQIHLLLSQADGLISGGGSLLQDATGIKSIIYYTGVIRIAKLWRKPVFVYAQGMGPINSFLGKKLVKGALNKNVQITVRDEESMGLLKEIGVRNSMELVPDPVMALETNTLMSFWLEEKKLSHFITVSVRDWPTSVDYKEKIALALDAFAKSGYDIVFVPMHGEYDEQTSLEVTELMTEKAHIAPQYVPIEEKIAIVKKSELLVGMRLHSLIFAAIGHIPFVALSYDPKIDSFAKICDQPVAGHVSDDAWTEQDLVDTMERALTDTYAKSEAIVRLQKEADDTAAIALNYLSR
ncbi:polysaccharide pyruvyl transferase CsaB [Halobacillus mangrovi]|uniref:Polysaccharide pyruvyl transferase CsaB n=1 Tax=Halobacillus mangrovi TaxID=402384 RepID=A0A1W5ZSF3_9BACI|nr:polysaccharide pyruvyl transferase CsaB [Halobacillus mangrovi]ARI76228.1 polysaccharide pyruvyl transferase CsaB [Halobacillus mangrovi]